MESRRSISLVAVVAATVVTVGSVGSAMGAPGNGQGKGIGLVIAPGQTTTLNYSEGNDDFVIKESSRSISAAQAAAVTNPNGTSSRAGVRNSRRLQSARRVASAGCWEGTETISDYSLGIFQDKWAHIVDWCGGGTNITSWTRNIGQNLSTGTFWSYVNSNSWGNRYSTYIDAFAQGHYCYLSNLGCPQSNWPTHRGNYNGNGTWSTTYLQLK